MPGYEGLYEVSDLGRVRSHDRMVHLGGVGNGGSFLKPGRILKPIPARWGRLQVRLCANGEQRPYQVHRLVMAAFVGPCPDGLRVLHWDDDPDNNQLSNLRYGTQSENMHDRVRNSKRRGVAV